MFRRSMLTLTYKLPSPAVFSNIEDAPSLESARSIYNDHINALLDDPALKQRFRNYFSKILGVGSPYSTDPGHRINAAINIWTYVFLNDLPVSEALTAKYIVSDAMEKITDLSYNGANGFPEEFDEAHPDYPDPTAEYDPMPHPDAGRRFFSGYFSTEYFLRAYSNRFKFKLIREILAVNLNAAPPYSNLDTYTWPVDMLAQKYRSDPAAPEILCHLCHSKINPLRSAFHKIGGLFHYDFKPHLFQYYFNALGDHPYEENKSYPYQWGQEPPDYENPDVILEPRNPADANNLPFDEEEAFEHFRLTQNGISIHTPYDLALAITAHPRFARSWTERIFTIVLNLNEGIPGPSVQVPDHFSDTEAKQNFINHWTERFIALDQAPKRFLREFLTSDDYLSLAVNL